MFVNNKLLLFSSSFTCGYVKTCITSDFHNVDAKIRIFFYFTITLVLKYQKRKSKKKDTSAEFLSIRWRTTRNLIIDSRLLYRKEAHLKKQVAKLPGIKHLDIMNTQHLFQLPFFLPRKNPRQRRFGMSSITSTFSYIPHNY